MLQPLPHPSFFQQLAWSAAADAAFAAAATTAAAVGAHAGRSSMFID